MAVSENIDLIHRLGCKFHGKCHFRIWCRKYLPRDLKKRVLFLAGDNKACCDAAVPVKLKPHWQPEWKTDCTAEVYLCWFHSVAKTLGTYHMLMPDLFRVMSRCGETLLPQSLRLWSPLPPLLVRLGSVPQAFWRWSQNVCTDRWQAAHQKPPFHPCQDSAVPFCRGRSLRPGWNTVRGFKRSQEWSLMRNQRTGRAGSGFVAVRWELVLLGENDMLAALR